jgi:hypothetical protein
VGRLLPSFALGATGRRNLPASLQLLNFLAVGGGCATMISLPEWCFRPPVYFKRLSSVQDEQYFGLNSVMYF